MIVAGVISWLFVLAHESRIVAEEESQRQNRLLVEEIDAHKKTDLALQQAKETAEAANNAKSRYLTGISHELRTPLNAILGYAQLLDQDEQIPLQKKHQVKVIQRSAEHLTDLIEGLLDISKIEAGRLEIEKDVFNLNAMMNQIVDMFKLQAEEKGLQFRFYPKSALPDLVQGDEKRVRQILINLLSNAVKFTTQGEVELSIRYRNQVAEIRVRDTGVGIPENEIERIFKPFERLRLPGAPVVSGTGLGLTITKLLVEIMGGDLTVSANPGGGVTFSVWLMLAHVYKPASETIKVKRIYGYHGKKIALLIVDDDAAHRGLMHDLLTPLGFVVVEAPDAESCLKLVRDFTPDAFLIDRRMPGMDGPALARTLRHMGFKQPVLMVSANAKEDAPQAEASPGYDAYLIKPVRLDSLIEKLGQQLNVSWQYDPVVNAPPTQLPDLLPLPPEDIVDELLGWAEVGALGKIREIVNRIERDELANPHLIARFRYHLDQVNLDALVDTIRAAQS